MTKMAIVAQSYCEVVKENSRGGAGGIPDVPPEVAVKNSDTLWQYRKNFKFLKEVKILSEFFRNKFGCLIQIYVRERRDIRYSAD
jgi:hypothetical protein